MKNNMNFYNREIGEFGENEACKYLAKLGYTIISRNFYTVRGEIDVIAIDKDEYVFFEVKTRTSRKFGAPVEAINKSKMNHIIKSSKYFIYKNGLEAKNIRFDIIEVYINDKNVFINHIKNVFF